jgi:chromate transport protein ChrA
MAVLVGLAVLHDAYGELPLVKAVLGGVACAASGMIIGTAMKMTVKLRPSAPVVAVGLAAVAGSWLLRLPLPRSCWASRPSGSGRPGGARAGGARHEPRPLAALHRLRRALPHRDRRRHRRGAGDEPPGRSDVHGWMSDAHFAQLFALAQAAPGPNIIVVGLIGWHVAGLAGMVVAMLAATGPSGLLAYGLHALPPPPGRPRLAADGGAGAGAGRGRADPGLRSHPGRGGGADGARGGDRVGVHPLRLADEPQPALGAGGGRGAGARCSCEARLFPGRGRSI